MEVDGTKWYKMEALNSPSNMVVSCAMGASRPWRFQIAPGHLRRKLLRLWGLQSQWPQTGGVRKTIAKGPGKSGAFCSAKTVSLVGWRSQGAVGQLEGRYSVAACEMQDATIQRLWYRNGRSMVILRLIRHVHVIFMICGLSFRPVRAWAWLVMCSELLFWPCMVFFWGQVLRKELGPVLLDVLWGPWRSSTIPMFGWCKWGGCVAGSRGPAGTFASVKPTGTWPPGFKLEMEDFGIAQKDCKMHCKLTAEKGVQQFSTCFPLLPWPVTCCTLSATAAAQVLEELVAAPQAVAAMTMVSLLDDQQSMWEPEDFQHCPLQNLKFTMVVVDRAIFLVGGGTPPGFSLEGVRRTPGARNPKNGMDYMQHNAPVSSGKLVPCCWALVTVIRMASHL